MEKTATERKIEKLEKKLDVDFKIEVQKSGVAELNSKVVELSKRIQEVDDDKQNNVTLQSLKEQLKDLNGGYSDARKAIKNKLEYILATLKVNEQ